MITRRERAIARMTEARDIHQVWVDGLRAKDPWFSKPQPAKKTGGGIKHHEYWVRAYNEVLRELTKEER